MHPSFRNKNFKSIRNAAFQFWFLNEHHLRLICLIQRSHYLKKMSFFKYVPIFFWMWTKIDKGSILERYLLGDLALMHSLFPDAAYGQSTSNDRETIWLLKGSPHPAWSLLLHVQQRKADAFEGIKIGNKMALLSIWMLAANFNSIVFFFTHHIQMKSPKR